jgi:hypothetical protein
VSAVRLEGGGPLFSHASALGLLVAGTTGHRFVLAGVGMAGVLVFLPWVVEYSLGGAVGVAVVILLSGGAAG